VTSSSKTGLFLVALALAVGGALLGLALVASPPAFLTTLGAVLVLAGFGLAFLRGGDRRFALGTLVVILAIIAAGLAIDHWNLLSHVPDWLAHLAPLVPIVLLALLAALLGTISRKPKAKHEP
jgi:hypothetical protein